MSISIDLSGKTAIVTGGTQGIGRAIVEQLVAAGANVAITYHTSERAAEELAQTHGDAVLPLDADCRSRKDSESAVAAVRTRFGGLDIVVANAGIAKDRVIWNISPDDFATVIDTNLTGTYNTIAAAAPHLRAQQYGRIVTVASINGLRGKAGQSAYAASKGGIIALTKSAAKELGRKNITVNAIAPGLILTRMTESLPAHIMDAAICETATKRLGTVTDVANAVVFLCSDMAGHITGQTINVDGGQLM